MIKVGARVVSPGFETTVSPTKDGDLLAGIRTGSTVKSNLVSVRSTDHGKTWQKPEVLPFAGKLPMLHLVDNGVLTVTTPANRRVDAWQLRIGPKPRRSKSLSLPTNLKFKKGALSWTPAPVAVAYRVTPVLIKPGDLYPTTLVMPCAAIQPRDDSLPVKS